jgi:outer membrane protein OmpA-like peptidoglycan-associated protein
MKKSVLGSAAFIAFIFIGCAAGPASALTLGYAEAIDQFATSCRTDMAKYCKNEPLGGGNVRSCLQRQPGLSARCSGAISALSAMLQKRAAARAAVIRVCDADAKRYCAGVQPGDGNLMECFSKAKARMSAACRQAVEDAGYEVGLAPATSHAPIKLSPTELVNSLQGVEAAPVTVNAAQLHQLAVQSLSDPHRTQRLNREPLFEQLNSLAQFTIAVQFDFNSSRIRPDSFRAVGLMADALYHPYLQGYHFLIVGHTDAVGSREYNLKLSQERADAIRDALINPFGISPARLEAVGLGEEQLLDPKHPEAAANRRVQLINIGK